MGSSKQTGKPTMVSSKNGDSRIIHREYIQDVNMAINFTSTPIRINPGLARMFPWLAAVANRFESYRFRDLRFVFETSCSSTQTGTVILVIDFQSTDLPPVSKTQALAYRNATRSQPWLSNTLYSAREDISKRKSYYIRSGPVANDQAIDLFDVGQLMLCVQGSDTNVVGELWVEYDIELMTPQLSPDASSASITGAGTVSKVDIFGTLPTITGSVEIDVVSSTITFRQAFEGLVELEQAGTGVVSAPVVSGTATRSSLVQSNNAASTTVVSIYRVRAQPGTTIAWDSTSFTTITSSRCRLAAYNYLLG
jgi:hypothetical protein